MKYLLRSLSLAAILVVSSLHAQVPQLVNYQGRVAAGNPAVNFNGTGQFKFALVNAAGTTTFWSNNNTSTNGSEPTAAIALPVSNGLFSLLLGDTTIAGMPTAIPASVWTNPDVRLRVWFNDGTAGSQLLTPDQRLAPNGYLADGSVSGAALATGAVTSAKIAGGAVTNTQLAVNAVQATNIAAGAVGGAQLANLSVQAANITDGAVTSAKILDGTVSSADLANDSASLSKVSDGNLVINSSRLFVTNGVIQNTGAPLTGTGDMGLYSQSAGNFMRFVTNGAPFNWYTDSGIGSVTRMSLTAAGNLGVGTPFPSSKLEVAGEIKGSSATIPTLNGNVAVGGALSAPSATIPSLNGAVSVGGTLSAPSATIPTLNGNVTVGGEVTAEVVTVLGGSDVAEPYEVESWGSTQPAPGMVVAIDPNSIGQMRIASHAYDKTVAGILSGANGIAPGITLRQKGIVADGSFPVASIGRVWCWCDADANGPIEAGDMLTTSDTAGHAMKVNDHTLANGSVIGAMSGLKSGKGLVLVLVSLK